jgi:transcriptional regulator with XRE-family HTH domain
MPHSVDIHVGQRLRLRRSMLGLSQAGITFQQVQTYERGINRMGASRLYEFSKMLSTPVTYFFEGYNDGSRSAVAEGSTQGYEAEGFASKDTMALVRAFIVI